MPGRCSGRKHKANKQLPKPCDEDKKIALAAFKLPVSLPGSEIEFPVLLKPHATANWKEIVEDNEKWQQELESYKEAHKIEVVESPFLDIESDYIQNEIFIHLIPALIETLNKAVLWKVLDRQDCFFNGIDHIAQLLWNNNPRYPERKKHNLHLFNMPWVRKQLIKQPRKFYPKSWLWPEIYAATVIQKNFRRYLVQKEDSVQEMRDFWKRLKLEDQNPDIDENPFLSKKFATVMPMYNFH